MEVLKIRSIFLLIVLWISLPEEGTCAVNGGTGCAACGAVLGIMDQLAEMRDSSIFEELKNLCNLLPEGLFHDACIAAVNETGPIIQDLYDELGSVDLVCHTLGVCYVDPGEDFCHLYPLPQDWTKYRQSQSEHLQSFRAKFGTRVELCDIPGFDKICEAIERIANNLPFSDVDGDRFSTFPTLRGSDWRGKDCNDFLASHYPGRRPENGDAESDSNCNGIYGVNEETGIPYEEELCGGQTNYGVMILGDSAGANFHIPKEWLTPSLISKEVFSYLPAVLSNEFNWPMTSSVTGYKNITAPVLQGHTDSIYWRMLQRNLCNHRDFQNIARNGGASGNILRITQTLARDNENDNPLLVILSIIGNDVCTRRKDAPNGMTTPEEMKERVLLTLDFLEETIPAGSHVVLTGLVDGRLLWNNLHDRIHPLGELRQDVTYEKLYGYLNCVDVSPCRSWMTSNETLRDLTSERAANLSIAMKEVAESNTFSKFDMFYMDFPANEVMDEWEEIHGPKTAWQLIEAVDGFHPSQMGQAAFAAKIWEHIERDFPQILGDINPNNQRIVEIFGDQGGYD